MAKVQKSEKGHNSVKNLPNVLVKSSSSKNAKHTRLLRYLGHNAVYH